MILPLRAHYSGHQPSSHPTGDADSPLLSPLKNAKPEL